MAQNVERWLLDRENFPWAQQHVPLDKWYRLGKYFPGMELRRDMKYIDAATGAVVDRSGHREVPAGRVFLYGYDVASFVGIPVAGLDTGTAGPVPVPGEQRGSPAQSSAQGEPR